MTTFEQPGVRQPELRSRGMGQLVKDLSQQVSTLVRQEVELAKAEASEKAAKAALGIGMLAAAAVAALMLVGAVTATLVLVLDTAMPAWAAALIVSCLWLVAAIGLTLSGRTLLRRVGSPAPEKTIETVKEDIEWAKDRIASGRR